jgi:ubiquinone/menaquinone biosynthesis C-methylase UbiE
MKANTLAISADELPRDAQAVSLDQSDVPDYLSRYYWWAYLHPWAVRFFDRHWMINLILLGNYRRLGNAALAALGSVANQRVLQVACVYGDLTPRLVGKLEGNASLDVVDVAQIQLDNLQRKLSAGAPVHLKRENATKLDFADGHFDKTLLFFLLHEQPEDIRRATLAEALRLTRPGGRLVIVDYHAPRRFNPVRYFMSAVLKTLEPFAMDLWKREISDYFPANGMSLALTKRTCFANLYQIVCVET